MAVARSSARRLLDADHRAQEELIRRYEPLVHRVVRRLQLPPCCQFEDLAQEARIGLLAAVREWEPERGPFAPFADRCMTNQALRALETACSQKHQALNRALPIEGVETGSSSFNARISSSAARMSSPAARTCSPAAPMGSFAPRISPSNACTDPEYRLLVREELQCLVSALPTLTRSERAALAGTLNGHSHTLLGKQLGGTPKAAAQAIYRARRKLAAALSRAA